MRGIIIFLLCVLWTATITAQTDSSDREEDTGETGAIFLENESAVHTIDELKERFPGKVVLVDLWATWCRPCVEEIQYYDDLYWLAAKHDDFVILFVSFDVKDPQRWKRFIQQREMEGYHILPDKTLAVALSDELNSSTIPHYALLNAEGQWVDINAPRPSMGNALVRKIRHLLN